MKPEESRPLTDLVVASQMQVNAERCGSGGATCVWRAAGVLRAASTPSVGESRLHPRAATAASS
eukprot:scaffold7066_cov253-Pinguiococcus_pyrenoidosus.AAC.53